MQSKNQLNLSPELRFTQFQDDWLQNNLGHLFIEVNERVGKKKIDTYSISSGIGFVSQKEKFGRDISGAQNERYTLLKPGQFSYNKGNSKTYKYGCVYLNKFNFEIALPNVFICFQSSNNSVLPEFFSKYFEAHKLDRGLRKIISSTARMDGLLNVNKDNFFKLKVNYPNSIEEQRKISAFLLSIDNWLDNLRKQKNIIERYKKGVIYRIFTKKIKFRDENGKTYPEWENGKMDDVFERITQKNNVNNKNVLTISAQQGLINQEDYFNKSVSSKDLSNYYLLNYGDFAYNKSYSAGYPMGAIKRLTKYDKGVVSPLYICFRIKSNRIDGSYIEKYFDAGKLNHEINKIAQEGARNHGLLNMSVNDFFKDVKLQIPSLPEQIKIANFLNSIDSLLDIKLKQILLVEKWKKGLLKLMLV